MNFEQSLWDGSDPTYAPCTGRSSGLVYWKAPAKYRKAGYLVTTVRLPGKEGDGLYLERAAKARELTREMVRWYEGEDAPEPVTWGDLIARYKSDDISPMQDVKANTREIYMFCIGRWEAAIGESVVAETTYADLKWWLKTMSDNGRTNAYIKRMFTMLRMIAGYGRAIEFPGASKVKEVLGELRIKSPRPRTASPTEAQIMAVVKAADEAGHASFALGILFQWRLALRAMDVRGDYFRLKPKEERSGICRGQFRWGGGLTWDMFDRDLNTLSKTPTKTEDSLQELITWDLRLVQDIRDRLSMVPAENRVGPVILDRRGMPFRHDAWSDLWRKHRVTAGLPDTIQVMDIRAGAINDAKSKGASKILLQQQANHADGKTTERYIRERSDGVNNVLRIRQERS